MWEVGITVDIVLLWEPVWITNVQNWKYGRDNQWKTIISSVTFALFSSAATNKN
jgi:hypothetical protein